MINVLISTYNGEKYIKEQLDSIFSQTVNDFHVYIRDDGSMDDTVGVVKAYIAEEGLSDKITLFQGKNIGFCASFFELLKKADDGDYWAFCDQDDYWLPDKLKNACAWFEKNNDEIPLMYHSSFYVGNEDLSKKTPYIYKKYDFQFYNSITSSIYFGFAMVINRKLRELLLEANPNNIKYHDWFCSMIAVAFGQCYLSPSIDAIHRQYETNASPLYFFKKIPHGIKMLKGDRFYTMQAREFKRVYGARLSQEDRAVLEMFQKEKHSPITALKKTFYPRRWNPQIKVEIILRLLMLAGII